MPVLNVPVDIEVARRIETALRDARYYREVGFAHGPRHDADIGVVVETGYRYADDLIARLERAGFTIHVTHEPPVVRPTVGGTDARH